MPENNTIPTEEELKKLRLFRERVADLERKGLVKAGKTKITVNIAGVVPDVIEGLDEDHLASFLQTMRQFTLDRDPVHFYSICNIVYRNCKQPELRDWLIFARRLWKQTMAMSPLSISIDGHCPSLEEILELFLYGGMIHSDEDKAEKIRNMTPQVQGIMKMMLLCSIGGLCHALALMEKILWHWLDAPSEVVPSLQDED